MPNGLPMVLKLFFFHLAHARHLTGTGSLEEFDFPGTPPFSAVLGGRAASISLRTYVPLLFFKRNLSHLEKKHVFQAA